MSIPFKISVNEERQIRGDFFPSIHDSAGTLVICHGFKGFKDWGFFPHTAEQLAQYVNVITFNFSHNGVGEDPLQFSELEKFATDTYTRDLEDLQLLIQHIQENSLPIQATIASSPLFLLGHSRGAGVSLIYAMDHAEQIDGVISWNGITNVDLFSQEIKDQMRQDGRAYIQNARTKQEMPLDIEILEDIEKNRDQYNILARASSTTVPIILVQGSDDAKNLREGSAKLVDANPAIQWVTIAGGNHTFNAVHPFKGETLPLKEAITYTAQFIQERLQRR
jgi:alpha-beta hydrolase superfamily lysophospholipase